MPPIPFDEADPHSRRLRGMCRIDAADLTDEQIRRARHAYFAAISYVDDRIGQVLGALREAGFEDDTIVVFTADHGEMLGERGLWYKMAFFEDSARVPLVVRAPGRPRRAGHASRRRSRCSTSPPTLLELAGSTRPISADRRPEPRAGAARGGPPRRAVVAEYLAEG